MMRVGRAAGGTIRGGPGPRSDRAWCIHRLIRLPAAQSRRTVRPWRWPLPGTRSARQTGFAGRGVAIGLGSGPRSSRTTPPPQPCQEARELRLTEARQSQPPHQPDHGSQTHRSAGMLRSLGFRRRRSRGECPDRPHCSRMPGDRLAWGGDEPMNPMPAAAQYQLGGCSVRGLRCRTASPSPAFEARGGAHDPDEPARRHRQGTVLSHVLYAACDRTGCRWGWGIPPEPPGRYRVSVHAPTPGPSHGVSRTAAGTDRSSRFPVSEPSVTARPFLLC